MLCVVAATLTGCASGAADGQFANATSPPQCPSSPQEPGLQGPLSAAVRKPVPFTPTSAMLCLYKDEPSSATPTEYREAFSQRLDIPDSTKAAALATDLNAAAKGFGGGHCGNGSAEVVAVYFQDPDHAIEVLIKLADCASAENGGNHSSIANSNFPAELMALFGCAFPRPDQEPPNWWCGP